MVNLMFVDISVSLREELLGRTQEYKYVSQS